MLIRRWLLPEEDKEENGKEETAESHSGSRAALLGLREPLSLCKTYWTRQGNSLVGLEWRVKVLVLVDAVSWNGNWKV